MQEKIKSEMMEAERNTFQSKQRALSREQERLQSLKNQSLYKQGEKGFNWGTLSYKQDATLGSASASKKIGTYEPPYQALRSLSPKNAL